MVTKAEKKRRKRNIVRFLAGKRLIKKRGAKKKFLTKKRKKKIIKSVKKTGRVIGKSVKFGVVKTAVGAGKVGAELRRRRLARQGFVEIEGEKFQRTRQGFILGPVK